MQVILMKMKQKDCVAVICEYNPLHFGHKHQLMLLKERFERVVCIMSGNIVQRGSVAVADKYLRAEAALKSGADLVVELPVPWCCSSARDFARAGVHIANALGVTHLAFGAEDGEELISEISNFLESGDFKRELAERSEKSLSYPQLLTSSVERHLGAEYAQAVKKPNNILALEYISALKGRGIKPFFVKREQKYLSSSQIRASGDMLSLLPDESKAVFAREEGKHFPRDEKRLDSFFVGTLRRMIATPLPQALYACPDDLANKILRSAQKQSSVLGIVEDCTDKNYTSARVRRAINALVFGISAKRLSEMPPYTAVLAANESGCEQIKLAKKLKRTDIVNKPVRALEQSEETKNAFLFAKGIEDILYLAEPTPESADTPKNPLIIGEKR